MFDSPWDLKSPRERQDIKGSVGNLLEGREPAIDVLANLIFGKAISLLKPTFELLAFAVDCGEIIVGKFAPLLLHLASELLQFPSI